MSVSGFGTSKRLTHGTTTLSQEQEDYDRKTIDGKTYYIKPKSLYPDRDDGREKFPDGEAEDRTNSRVRRKCLLFEFQIWFRD